MISLFDRDQPADGLAPGETKGRRFTGLYNTVNTGTLQDHYKYIAGTHLNNHNKLTHAI